MPEIDLEENDFPESDNENSIDTDSEIEDEER
jgi:hypothetical protein